MNDDLCSRKIVRFLCLKLPRVPQRFSRLLREATGAANVNLKLMNKVAVGF